MQYVLQSNWTGINTYTETCYWFYLWAYLISKYRDFYLFIFRYLQLLYLQRFVGKTFQLQLMLVHLVETTYI